ncbi:MAG: sulfatase-like hydrolase/transferase, partial [Bacteroidota bacterium]
VMCVAIFALGCGPSAPRRQLVLDPPNVILILADDLALGDLSFVNQGQTYTPHLDQLFETGLWFSQAYSASAVCAPARASLLTGLYPHQTGCVSLNMQRFPGLTRIAPQLETMADAFLAQGYATGLIGKWHGGKGEGYHPLDRGFQEFEGFIGADQVPSYFNYRLESNQVKRAYDQRYLTDDLTQRSLEFIRRHQNEPFFLHLAHYAPHRPIEAPQAYLEKYLDQGFNEATATVYAMIEVMDQGIGQLIEALDTLGLREKTLIIFSSDNGPDPLIGSRENQGLRGSKYTVYEGGIRVPWLINWPGTVAPGRTNEVIHFTDLFPTLVECCVLDPPTSHALIGRSLVESWLTPSPNPDTTLRYWQWNRGLPDYSHNAAVRRGKWKLVRPYQTRQIPEGPSQQAPVLYDLSVDPSEQHNVAESHPQVYQSLRTRLAAWSQAVEADRLKNLGQR